METLLAVEEDGTVCPGHFRRTGGCVCGGEQRGRVQVGSNVWMFVQDASRGQEVSGRGRNGLSRKLQEDRKVCGGAAGTCAGGF